MANNADDDVIVRTLRNESEIQHERLMQIDRIIKKVKGGGYVDFSSTKVGEQRAAI